MPLGIISDDDLVKELDKIGNDQEGDNGNEGENGARLIPIPNKGRQEGSLEVPNELRKLIAEESLLGTPSKELQEIFGVSPSSVSAYKNGATSTATYNEGAPELKLHVNEAKERISKRAQVTLDSALNALTPDKIAKSKARDIAGIAKDMSVIMKNMEPEKDSSFNDGKPLVQFTFHVPPMKKETDYEVIQVEQ